MFNMLQIQQFSDSGDSEPDESVTTHLKPLDDGKPIALKTVCAAPDVTSAVQEEAARQQAPHAAVGYVGKVPQSVPQVMPPPQLQRGSAPGPGPGPTPLLSMDQWQQNRYQTANVGNAGLRHPNPQLMQQNQPGAQGPIVGAMSLSQSGPNPQSKQVLQQLLQMLRSPNTPEQQQQILQLLKSNPQLMAAFIKQRQTIQQMQQQQRQQNVVQEEAARQQAPHAAVGYVGKVPQSVPQVMPPPQLQRGLAPVPGPGPTPLLSMDQWQQNRYQTANVGNAGLRQPNPQLMQQNQPGAQGPIVGAMRLSQPGPNPQSKQALQQLLQTLRSPNTPEQQQQILQILKSNPQLMAAFIKQRQTFQQMQQQQQQQNVVNVNVPQAQAPSLQHMMNQQQNPQQNRLHMQMSQQNPQMVQQQPNWYKHQQMLAIQQQQRQQQQQQQQQQSQQFPGGYTPQQQRLPMRSYTQGFPDQYTVKPNPSPVQSPQGVMGPPGMSQQQLMSVRSPPPIRSPQPNPSPRPVQSPRNQPVPSPHHDLGGPSEMMLSQLGSSAGGLPPPAPPPPDDLTPQDQLTKYVENL